MGFISELKQYFSPVCVHEVAVILISCRASQQHTKQQTKSRSNAMNQNINQSAVIEEISSEEAAGVMGGRIFTRKVTARRLKRIMTKKNVVRMIRLKNGHYTVKYKEEIRRPKTTVSQTNFRPARNWSFS